MKDRISIGNVGNSWLGSGAPGSLRVVYRKRNRLTRWAVAGLSFMGLLVLASPSSAKAQISVSHTSLSFTTPQYATSTPKSLLVTNTGASSITFGQISFSGTDAGDFASTSDSCSLHTIAVGKKCKVSIAFSATASRGTTENASLSINDSNGNSLASVALNGVVAKGPVTASLSGLTVTISNLTKSDYTMDFSISGPYSDTGTGTCTDVVLEKSRCTIVLQQDSPGTGEITIDMAPLGAGKSYVFNIDLS